MTTQELPALRYDGLYEYAQAHRLDYNELCAVARAALAAQVEPQPVAWIQELVRAWNEAYPRMDIYAKPGTLVMFDARGGYESEQENAKKVLQMRGLYEVEYTEVGGTSTAVKLRGVDRRFNSVLFAAPPLAAPQSRPGEAATERDAALIDDDEQWAVDRGADLLEQYAAFINRVQPEEIEEHPYLPELEHVAKELRALSRRISAAALSSTPAQGDGGGVQPSEGEQSNG